MQFVYLTLLQFTLKRLIYIKWKVIVILKRKRVERNWNRFTMYKQFYEKFC